MHKLVILIQSSDYWAARQADWPEFLHLVEAMPNLRREAASHVEQLLYSEQAYIQMHELFFDSLADAEQALASPQGKAAGRLLQKMTNGKVTLFLATHQEDELANIQKSRNPENRET